MEAEASIFFVVRMAGSGSPPYVIERIVGWAFEAGGLK
jgi:replication-associated recombination protein RarA